MNGQMQWKCGRSHEWDLRNLVHS